MTTRIARRSALRRCWPAACLLAAVLAAHPVSLLAQSTTAEPSEPTPEPASAAALDCRLYGEEDLSVSGQRRARLFVATADPRAEAALALGYDAAVQATMTRGLDYVDVFVTRTQDGLDRAEHSAATALAWVRFNPGGTPVIPTRMEGQVATDTVGRPDWGLVLVERREVSGAEINGAWLDLRGAGENLCGV